jgi:hypothetical protein
VAEVRQVVVVVLAVVTEAVAAVVPALVGLLVEVELGEVVVLVRVFEWVLVVGRVLELLVV